MLSPEAAREKLKAERRHNSREISQAEFVEAALEKLAQTSSTSTPDNELAYRRVFEKIYAEYAQARDTIQQLAKEQDDFDEYTLESAFIKLNNALDSCKRFGQTDTDNIIRSIDANIRMSHDSYIRYATEQFLQEIEKIFNSV